MRHRAVGLCAREPRQSALPYVAFLSDQSRGFGSFSLLKVSCVCTPGFGLPPVSVL